jgi:hypothetical protein
VCVNAEGVIMEIIGRGLVDVCESVCVSVRELRCNFWQCLKVAHFMTRSGDDGGEIEQRYLGLAGFKCSGFKQNQ